MKYPFSVFQTEIEKHIFWIAKSNLLKGCIGQGDTQEEAIKELAENEKAWLETAKEVGIKIPDVPVEKLPKYSGKMTLRISPSVHSQAAEFAKKEGISLNQYINDAIVRKNSYIAALMYK